MIRKSSSVPIIGQRLSFGAVVAAVLAFVGLVIVVYGVVGNVAGLPMFGGTFVFCGLLIDGIGRGRSVFGDGSRATPAQKRIWFALAASTGACLAAGLGAWLSVAGAPDVSRMWPAIALTLLGATGVLAVQTYWAWVQAGQRMPRSRDLGIK